MKIQQSNRLLLALEQLEVALTRLDTVRYAVRKLVAHEEEARNIFPEDDDYVAPSTPPAANTTQVH